MSQFHIGAALAGLVFVVIGALFLLNELAMVAVSPGILGPAALIGLGVVAIVGALVRGDEA